MKNFEKLLFFLLLASFPIQLGKHFWPQFSFVHGIRVDYLSPTLYLSDILLLLFIVVTLPRVGKKFFFFLKKPVPLLFLAVLILSTLFSYQNELSVISSVRYISFFYFAFYLASSIKKREVKNIIFLFSGLAVMEAILVISQFIIQHSAGGLLYFLGERSFSSSTLGIATFQMNGSLLLRGYGTFPHPNVAAFFLFVSFVLLLFYKVKGIRFLVVKTVILVIIFLGILATFSRILILSSIAAVIYSQLSGGKNKKGKKAASVVGITIALLLVELLLFPRFLNGIFKDWLYRIELLNIFGQIFIQHPLFGVGSNAYFYPESAFQKTVSPILLQPVHNIYLLWVVQTGLGGVLILILFLKRITLRLLSLLKMTKKNSLRKSAVVMMIAACIVGLFDHYLLTLQQGSLLGVFVTGLFFSKSINEG